MNRFVRLVDGIAALLMFAVAAFTLVAVIGRRGFGWSPPDYFDFARLILGIAIFWGIAAACYRNGHILVDIVYEMVGERWRRPIDIVATAILAVFMGALAWMTLDAVQGAIASKVSTAELRTPLWIFYAVACAGAFVAVILTLVRLARLIAGGDTATVDEPAA
jgi:TRAP-type C4-dicarboxylate transport system permease small subunit